MKQLLIGLALLSFLVHSEAKGEEFFFWQDPCAYEEFVWDEGHLEWRLTREDVSSSISSFHKLPIAEKEGKTISKIIKTLAESNIYKLLWRKSEIERMGDSIHHLHPLRFLGHIFHDQSLHNCMRTIKRSYFKWNGFMNGLNGRMVQENERDNILPHIYGFADYINCSQEETQEIIDLIYIGDWEQLVEYLINR